jgi:flagellin
MLSIQTNVDSLIAQQNLGVNNQFQSNTIQQLTSGYRINEAGDDAAGLAVANQYRDQIAELNQGVLNANDGQSQLQIMDGGLDNVSTMLDRLQTLATESASSTFTGNRSTLNNEYQNLLSEIDRQADNIGLGANNSSNIRNIGVYIGGGQNSNTNSSVNVDLTNSGVGTIALGIGATNVLTNGAVTLGNATTPAVAATVIGAGNTDTFTFVTGANTAANPTNPTTTVTVTGKTGDTVQGQVNELNAALQAQGLSITASLNSAGALQFQSANAFSVSGTTSATANDFVTTGAYETANNTGLNNLTAYSTATAVAGTGTDIQITAGGTTVDANIGATAGTTIQAQADAINQALQAAGVTSVTAVVDLSTDATAGTASTATSLAFQGSEAFTVANDFGATAGTYGAATSSTAGTTAQDPQNAINAIAAAIQSLGQTQGKIGAGENTLNYAISLAQSQITNFSSAQSQIRDANVAQEAANLTKAQVLQQTSIAAMAQANAEPQALLKLFQ